MPYILLPNWKHFTDALFPVCFLLLQNDLPERLEVGPITPIGVTEIQVSFIFMNTRNIFMK